MESLYILWTTSDIVTARHMVFMYARNSLLKRWWDGVNIIVWGASSKLISDSEEIQAEIKELMELGVNFIACRACSEKVGSYEALNELGIKTEYIGEYLTEIIKDHQNHHLITI